MSQPPIAIVIHGGAGTITRAAMTPALEKDYRDKLAETLEAGYAVLKADGRALDAGQAAGEVMEDSPLFNAGRGAVFSRGGVNRLDASIMDGATLDAGAVGAVQGVAHPIRLACTVMTESPHVMLVGRGAEDFAWAQGFEFTPASWFHTERRWREHVDGLEKLAADSPGTPELLPGGQGWAHGTVGAVALDREGHVAAGTSTGGLNNMMDGRLGDSAVIGAGTYADDATCAASGTGVGEFYIRLNLTKSISDLMEMQGWPLEKAAEHMVKERLVKFGGGNTGGVIALDRKGNIATPFNTSGMYRGWIAADGKRIVRIYEDE